MNSSCLFWTTYLALSLGFSCISQAEEINDDIKKNDIDLLETIQIRGIRGSLHQSMNTKRFSDSIVDVITAEEIGKFPDKNVAESLQRITGVSLTRMQGEGERIGVRGTAPSQNRTYINGQNIASADWWISSQPNRGFNYTMLPAEIVSSLEVNKSPEADHDEGSLGGSVNIKTRSPLNTENNMFVGTTQLQYSDISENSDPQVSILYNWINDKKDFGALISLIRHERSLRRDGLESWGWSERNFNKTLQNGLVKTDSSTADYQGIWSPGGGGSAIFQQSRVLSSAMLSLEYQPDLDWNIELRSLYSRLSADNKNQNFLWQPRSVYAREGHILDYDIQDNTLAYARYSKVPADNKVGVPFSTSMEAIWRKSQIQTSLIHLSIEHNVDYWQNRYQVGVTQASGGTSKDFTSQWSANSEYSVDLRDNKNVIAQYHVSPLDAKAWQISEVRRDKQDSKDREFFAQADFELQLDRPLIQSIKFGAKYKHHDRDLLRLRSRNGGYTGMAGGLDWTLSDFSGDLPKNYLEGIGSKSTLNSYAYADLSKLNTSFDELNFIQSTEKPSSFDITESSYAVYSKINFSGENYRGNLGVRVVHTEQSANAFQKTVDNEPNNNEYLWVETSKSYTDILPSINISMDWTDDIVFRVSASKVMSRPEYNHLMPSTNYNVTQAQGAGGNADLDPFRATKFDLGIEWYFDDTALFSAVAFHQDVVSFIDINRNKEIYEDIEMIINRPVNGSGGTIYGAELSLQQELFYGFGVIANYTYVQGKRKDLDTGKKIDIPGNSEHMVNFTTYYENEWSSTRLSYNFRTDFATGIGEEITDDFGQWDLNISFVLTDSISLVIEGINLTDEVLYTYERNEFSPIGIYRNGRRLYAGARVNF
jgi:iron complex outermembrane receptor protein